MLIFIKQEKVKKYNGIYSYREYIFLESFGIDWDKYVTVYDTLKVGTL